MVSMNFDAGQVAPSVPFEPLPDGKYLVVITETAQESTKDGRGAFLKFRFEVIEGPYKGKPIWTRLNLVNSSDQAVAIARAELSAICRAVGVMKPTQSEELHNLPLVVKVVCKRRKDSSEIDNVIKSYEARNATPPAAMSPTAPTTAPWARPPVNPATAGAIPPAPNALPGH